jgi:hypothetical protein
MQRQRRQRPFARRQQRRAHTESRSSSASSFLASAGGLILRSSTAAAKRCTLSASSPRSLRSTAATVSMPPPAGAARTRRVDRRKGGRLRDESRARRHGGAHAAWPAATPSALAAAHRRELRMHRGRRTSPPDRVPAWIGAPLFGAARTASGVEGRSDFPRARPPTRPHPVLCTTLRLDWVLHGLQQVAQQRACGQDALLELVQLVRVQNRGTAWRTNMVCCGGRSLEVQQPTYSRRAVPDWRPPACVPGDTPSSAATTARHCRSLPA